MRDQGAGLGGGARRPSRGHASRGQQSRPGGGFGVSGGRAAGLPGGPEAGRSGRATSCPARHGPCPPGPHRAAPGPVRPHVRRTCALHVALQLSHKAARRTQNPNVLWDPKVKLFWLQRPKSQLLASARQVVCLECYPRQSVSDAGLPSPEHTARRTQPSVTSVGKRPACDRRVSCCGVPWEQGWARLPWGTRPPPAAPCSKTCRL